MNEIKSLKKTEQYYLIKQNDKQLMDALRELE